MTFNATAGTTYQIAVDGFDGSSGSITLNWMQAAPPVLFNFSQANYQVGESDNSATLIVTRPTTTPGGAPITGTYTVGYTLTDGTASAGSDYTATTGTLTFGDGQATMPLLINIINNAVVEPSETFNVSLVNPSSGTALGSQSTATVTIVDDDRVNSVRFASAVPLTVTEDANFLDLSVTRSGDTTGAVSVSYFSANGAASDRSDFATTRGTLNFAAGETQKTIRVFITDDAFSESSETFTVSLSGARNVTLEQPDSVTITITDNDAQQPKPNPVDAAQFFVRQHYVDFLNREPDAAGMAFWTNQIAECGSDAAMHRTAPHQCFSGLFPLHRISGDGLFRLSHDGGGN